MKSAFEQTNVFVPTSLRELSMLYQQFPDALLFAGGHFPQLTFHGWSLLIPFVVFSTSAGLILGWLYMRHGLVSAIVAHFVVDLLVYVIPRLLAALALL